MIFTQAFRQFSPNKKSLFHNNPSFEMVQYPQRRSSTEDLTKVTAAKPPSGRTKRKVMRRTNTDPGPLSADILTILLEQIPQCPPLGSLSKKSDRNSESSTYRAPAPFPVPDSSEPASSSVATSTAQSCNDTQTNEVTEPVKDPVAPPLQKTKSQVNLQSLTKQTGSMPGPITAHATSLSTPAAMSSSVSTLQCKGGASVTPPVSIPMSSPPQASYHRQLSSSLPDQCDDMRLRSSSLGSSPSKPSSQHFALSLSQTTPSPTMRTATPSSHSRLSPAYGPSANSLSWQQTPSRPQVIVASQYSSSPSSTPQSIWNQYTPGSSSLYSNSTSSPASSSYTSSLSSSFSPSSWSSSSFSTPTTTTVSSSPSSYQTVQTPKKWKPATFKPPPRTSSIKKYASSNTKPVVQDSRYDYMNQLPTTDVRQISEKKPRQVREPDASYNKSLPEYLPIKSPSISDDRFDDFDFSPPVTVTATKQELTRASAIAVYPFTAQSKKELSFKKGDTIYLTREIDKNWVEGEHHGNKGIFPRTYVEIVTSIEEARNLQVNAPSAEGKGRAKYRFKGETANELSVNKGEIVDLVRKIDNNWWEVRHGNKAGIVPVAYLDVLREPQQGLSSPQPKSPVSSGGGRGPLSPSQAPRSPSIQAHRSPSTQAPRSPSTQAPRSPSAPADNLYQPSSPYQSDTPTLGRQQPSHQNRAGQGSRSGGGGGGQRGMQPTGGRPAQNAGFHQKRPDGERFRAVYSYQPSNDDELEIMEGETVVVMEKCDDGWYVGFSEATGRFGTFPGNYVQRLWDGHDNDDDESAAPADDDDDDEDDDDDFDGDGSDGDSGDDE